MGWGQGRSNRLEPSPGTVGPGEQIPNARWRRRVSPIRRRCSGRSWSRWHRWHSALTLRCRRPQCPESWSRCAAASTTLVVRTGCASAGAGQGPCDRGHRARLCRASSHQRPSPRWRTTWPCGRPQCSQRPWARTKPTQRLTWSVNQPDFRTRRFPYASQSAVCRPSPHKYQELGGNTFCPSRGYGAWRDRRIADPARRVPVHGFETPICAYAALASGPIWSARTWAGVL